MPLDFISNLEEKHAYYKWRIDETYIKIKGKWNYLYRAIDTEGHTLDIWLRKQRDKSFSICIYQTSH